MNCHYCNSLRGQYHTDWCGYQGYVGGLPSQRRREMTTKTIAEIRAALRTGVDAYEDSKEYKTLSDALDELEQLRAEIQYLQTVRHDLRFGLDMEKHDTKLLRAENERLREAVRNITARLDRDGGQTQDGESIEDTAARADKMIVALQEAVRVKDAAAAELVRFLWDGGGWGGYARFTKNNKDGQELLRLAAQLRATCTDALATPAEPEDIRKPLPGTVIVTVSGGPTKKGNEDE